VYYIEKIFVVFTYDKVALAAFLKYLEIMQACETIISGVQN
jgi:hypothetical protein